MRNSLLLLLFFWLCVSDLHSQFKVHFIVSQIPAARKNDSIFLAGNFNGWQPGNKNFALAAGSSGYGITIDLPAGMYEYKFTQGSWQKVEVDAIGKNRVNRRIQIMGDTTIISTIEGWSQPLAKKSTVSKNVQVIDTAFYIPQLKRHRRIWIYLPGGYAHSKSRYPVLYMQDAQNVFDETTSFSGEWGVDEALDTLGPKIKKCIVVAIDNGGDKRINEYAPFDMEKYGRGEGALYSDFLAKTLKPFIDKHYRTKKEAASTFIAGSSMGGLLSLYALLRYPSVFGGAGVFSPAFWINPEFNQYVAKQAKKVNGKIYFYAGKHESTSMVPDMLRVFEQIHGVSKASMEIVIREEGQHSENTWRKEFPLFYEWLMTDQAGK